MCRGDMDEWRLTRDRLDIETVSALLCFTPVTTQLAANTIGVLDAVMDRTHPLESDH
jgi:hypothetical protein